MAKVKAVVGANWGDEGKGKITDMLAAETDIVVRYQGGANAGHTIVNDYGKFALHQLPSGVFYQHVTNVIGPGVALNVDALLKETSELMSRGVPQPNLLVDLRTQIVMPYHVLMDEYEEERLAHRKFGSTKSGIAPFYADKYSKIGFQVCELFQPDEVIREKLQRVLEVKNTLVTCLYGKEALDAEELLSKMRGWAEGLKPYAADWRVRLNEARKKGERILLEGQLGALRDPDYGIYPMVTSSSTLAGYGSIGAGVPPYDIQEIIAVVKAYSSSVGAGEFVSEIFGDEADELRNRGGDGGEFGATTGRPRRMGWLDTVASRYGVQVQGATDVVLSVIDVLGYLDEIPVCVGYEYQGEILTDFPVTPVLTECKPVWKVLPGWKCDLRGIRRFEDFPQEARDYVRFVENELGVRISMVSNGPGREDIVHMA